MQAPGREEETVWAEQTSHDWVSAQAVQRLASVPTALGLGSYNEDKNPFDLRTLL
jgi:hypothetical protein